MDVSSIFSYPIGYVSRFLVPRCGRYRHCCIRDSFLVPFLVTVLVIVNAEFDRLVSIVCSRPDVPIACLLFLFYRVHNHGHGLRKRKESKGPSGHVAPHLNCIHDYDNLKPLTLRTSAMLKRHETPEATAF